MVSFGRLFWFEIRHFCYKKQRIMVFSREICRRSDNIFEKRRYIS